MMALAHVSGQLEAMVISTLVRLKKQHRTESGVWPACKDVAGRSRRRQDRIIYVSSKRQIAAFRSDICCAYDYVLGELSLNRNVHLIRSRPRKIRCYGKKRSA